MTTEKEQFIDMLVRANIRFTSHPNDGNSVLVMGTLDFYFDALDNLSGAETMGDML